MWGMRHLAFSKTFKDFRSHIDPGRSLDTAEHLYVATHGGDVQYIIDKTLTLRLVDVGMDGVQVLQWSVSAQSVNGCMCPHVQCLLHAVFALLSGRINLRPLAREHQVKLGFGSRIIALPRE